MSSEGVVPVIQAQQQGRPSWSPLRFFPNGAQHDDLPTENFRANGATVERHVVTDHGEVIVSPMPFETSAPCGPLPASDVERKFLQSSKPPNPGGRRGKVRLVDLFSGCGGLTLGVSEACRALDISFESAVAIDLDPVALEVYKANFAEGFQLRADMDQVFDGSLGGKLTGPEKAVVRRVGRVDFLVGGPPCEGHSDFNNRTRHSDVRNALYLRMVRAAEVLEPQHIVIENVPGARRDRGDVVTRSLHALSQLGYHVSVGVMDASKLGVAQRRRRLMLTATRQGPVDVASIEERMSVPARSVEWAIGDLADAQAGTAFDEPVRSAPITRRRIDYLFANNLYELPDSERPACHSDRSHTYRSIYGRLKWDQPSQTITTGFYSMCMGRYVHPVRRRTLTAHEAARLQFFPDFFDFSSVAKRTYMAQLIGNAAPMKLSYAIALDLLSR